MSTIKPLFVVSLAILLGGCSRGDPDLELTKDDIVLYCDDVAQKAWHEANARDTNRPTSDGLRTIQSGVEAECILEYRIKQQEANKTF
jgi:hypothetical protein